MQYSEPPVGQFSVLPDSSAAQSGGDSALFVSHDAGRNTRPLAASTRNLSSSRSRFSSSIYAPHATRFPERARFALAVVVTLLYLVLLGAMFYFDINPSTATIRAVPDPASGKWTITWILPAGSFYEHGVRPGDSIAALDGVPIDPHAQSIEFAQHNNVTFASASGSTIGPLPFTPTDDNPVQRWTFAFLGLIFVGIGAPVFVKARQRTAASAFYVFCTATAVSLAFALGIASNLEWVQALQFVSLVVFACSFAFFFFNFPIRVGKTEARHLAIIASVVVSGAALLTAYAWVLAGHVANYPPVRLFLFVYLVGCVGAGLFSLVSSLVAQKSPEVKQQLVLLLGGTAFAVLPTALLSIIPQMFAKEIVSIYVTAVALVIMPLAFAYAITQHQLLGIRNFVRRSVVYVVMGSCVLLVFSIAASALSAITDVWTKNEFGLIGFGLFVFLIAFSFGYLQRRVEHYVDRFIYHDAYDYKEALLQFSSQLASEQDLTVLANQLVERTCRLMNLVCGVLVLASHADEERLAADHADKIASGNSTGTNGRKRDAMPPLAGLKLAAGGQVFDASQWLTAVRPGGMSHALSPSQSDGDTPVRLQVYAKFGDSADLMVAGLQDELSRLGVVLYQPDGSIMPVVLHTNTGELRGRSNVRRHSSLVASNATSTVGSLADAVSNHHVTEILTTRHLRGAEAEGAADLARSFLGVPLWTRSRFVGVLCLAGKKTGERFTKDDLSLLSTLGSQAALSIYNAQLSEAREQALLDTIAALAHAIEAKDGYTSEHCERMTDRAVAVAQAMGLSRQEVENVRLGAILHDVGKIGIPDAVLNKPGKLTPEEYEVIKQHATIGANIVSTVQALQGVVPIVRHHQERYDGSGYPACLKGADIPLGARIIGVVDAYGAMTEDRVYRKAPGHERAVAELQAMAGKQFDPEIVEVFLEVLEEHPELGEHHVPLHRFH